MEKGNSAGQRAFALAVVAGTCRNAVTEQKEKAAIPVSQVNRIKKKRMWQWADIWKRM